MSTSRIGIIGGSGLYAMPGFEAEQESIVETPWGAPSDNYVIGHGWPDAKWLSSRGMAAGIVSRPRS